MNITQLHIGGFGRLHDRELELGEGVTVLYGRNEAGKSTTLQFIRAMLYGIPGRSYPAERCEPLHGGQHGGKISIEDKNGVEWSIRRYAAGSESGRGERLSIVLRYPDGRIEEASQEDLERRLLGGISRSMFRQLFAVTLDELQELGALQSEEVGGYLLHAGMGGGSAILRAERKLVQDADKLYKPRGKVQEAAKQLQAVERLEREAAESRSYLPRYIETSAALEAVEERLRSLEAERLTVEADRRLRRKALEIRELWLKWKQDRLELDGLPVIGAFPEDGAARWQRLESDIQNNDSALFRLARQLEALQAEWAALQPDERLEAQGPLLESLDRRRGVYEERSVERQRLGGELSALREHLQAVLRGIGETWGRAELERFSGAAADREAARRFAAEFAAYDRRMETREAERQKLRSGLAAAGAALQAAERALAREHGASEFAGLAARSPREVLQLWDELQLAAERWREAQLGEGAGAGTGRPGGAPRRRAALLRVLAAAAALTVLLPAALWLTGAAPVSYGSAFGVLAAADLGLWAALRAARRAEGSPPRGGGEAEAAAAEMRRLQGLLLSGAEPESVRRRAPASPAAGGLEAGMKELRRIMDAWNPWRQRMEQLAAEAEACRTTLQSLQAQERGLHVEMERAEAEFEALSARYEEWLQERRLPEGISPEGLPDIFARAEQGKELLRQERKITGRLAELTAECTAYEDEIFKRMAEAGASAAVPDKSDISGTDSDSPLLLGWLQQRMREWDNQKKTQLRRESIAARLQEVNEELAEGRRLQERLQERSHELLTEGGAANGEEFLRRAAAAVRSAELIRSIRERELAMASGWEQEALAEVRRLLEEHDSYALEQAATAADAAAAAVEAARQEALERRGKLLRDLEYLKERCAEDTALQQLEEQRTGLRQLAEQYIVTSLTAELIRRTRRIYEQEKQPQVIKNASAYFSRLTGGEYGRIVMTLGQKELKAEHRELGLIDSARLSRGTAEQLYLALRLALAGSLRGTAALPLLLDDLFVNFDDRRLRAVLELLGDLSADRQIVMMTCHNHVAEAAKSLIPQAKIVAV